VNTRATFVDAQISGNGNTGNRFDAMERSEGKPMEFTDAQAREVTKLALDLDTARLRAWAIRSNSPEGKDARAQVARLEAALDELITRLKEKNGYHNAQGGQQQ
jgi:hypothetical protein